MTRTEAAKLMAVMAAGWSHQLSPEQLEVWYGTALERINDELGIRVARKLIAEDKFWPSPARFNEMRRALEADIPPERQLPEPRPTEPVWRKGLDEARAVLRQARSEK